ncbi:cytosine permease [Marisediminicola sp. LYQ85]|uniref:cytosine permease n=1 Tax=Marisediminicola sp. LYQ85 TaxID=3391062 RepID=UPI003983C406
MTATTSAPGSAETSAPIDPDYPLARVPKEHRKTNASVVIVIAGFLFFTPTMFAGGQVAVEFAFGEFLGLAAVATLVLATYIALIGGISARTGLTAVLLARAVFGKIGGKWSSILLGGTQIGWYGITLSTLTDFVGRAFGLDYTWPLAVIGGIAMATTAYWGFKGIEVLSWVSVPLMLALCVWVLVLSLDEVGGPAGMLALEGNGGLSVGAALTIMIGTFISGGTQMGNWTRFARNGSVAIAGTFVAVIVVQFAMLFFGGVGATAFGQSDFAELLVQLGLLVAGLFLLVANLWTTNDNTAYAFGLAGAELFNKSDKRPFIIAGVILGIIIAIINAGSVLIPFLSLLGVLIPPLGGALIGYFYLVWKGTDPGIAYGSEPLVRWSGLAAYLAGVAAAALGSTFDFGIPAVQGIIVAIIVAPLAAMVEKRMSGARVTA